MSQLYIMSNRLFSGWYVGLFVIAVLLILYGMTSDPSGGPQREHISAADKARSKIKAADHQVSSLIKRTENMLKQLN